MQFIDEVKIFIKSGDGGAGCLSFRREANVAKGGPDGGNGGKGGSIVFECIGGLNTLIDFRYTQHFKAKKGAHGKGQNRGGPASDDMIIQVPVGTQIFMDNGEDLLADLTEVGQKITLLEGGKGGLGNANFKSSTNQAPRKTTPGFPGKEMWIRLKLKLLSDVGIAGLPNAGKSTFVSSVTRAKPKIADYPFTTLKPQLGVFYVDDKEFVIADIPGLIEGAHEGHGLGHRFLKHIERCAVILHLIDVVEGDIVDKYKLIRRELEEYSKLLADKNEVVVLNKCDAMLDEELEEKLEYFEEATGIRPEVISAVTGKNTEKVLRLLKEEILASREKQS